jgi:hypothetical protein
MPDINTVLTGTPVAVSSGYTASEILKIEIAGGILVVAVLVITYAVYSLYMARYRAWLLQQELQDKIEAGYVPDPSEYPQIPKGVSKVLLFVVGGLVIAAGIVIMILP